MESETKKRHTRRRGQGEGSIFQRSDGRWVAKLAIGYDASGKRRRKTVYGTTKKEAQDKLLDLQQRHKLGTLPDAGTATLAQFLQRWLGDVIRVSVCEATHARYSQLVEKHINPRISGIRLERLKTSDVMQVYSEMERAGLSPRTRRFTHTVIRAALQQAADWGMVPRNICDTAKPPKVVRKEMKTLDAKQAASLMAAAKSDRLYAMYVLAVTTGMRQGELFALQWADIDFNGRILSVRRTITANRKVKEPKTATSKRRIDLSAVAVGALQQHRKKQLAYGLAASPWVFSDTIGGLLSRHNVLNRSFAPILKAAKLPVIRFHDLRHTAATLMLAEGVNPRLVSETLGHASVAFTLDVYGHILPGMGRDAADKMGRLLGGKAS
jgi:integrase